MSDPLSTIDNHQRTSQKHPRKRIMVAGIGNTFLQDDGFGAEVIKSFREKQGINGLYQDIELHDVGIGGLKLAYDLMKGYDALILVDASPRGESPGTLYVIEPDEKEVRAGLDDGNFIDPHGCDPATVLRFVKSLGAWPGKVVIIGCEPGAIEDFGVGLTEPVKAAVGGAVILLEETIESVRNA